MNIGIIDCGGANLNSIYYSFRRINVNPLISDSVSELRNMDAYILPGVGSAGIVMNKLKEKNLINLIKETKKPTLGICIGMQILFDYSEEDDTQCLGLIEGDVKKFKPDNNIKVPQMGWNNVISDTNSLNGYYYFANSYYTDNTEYAIGYSYYGKKFNSIVKKNNFFGCQFHPEKSSDIGETFIKNFINII
ncbi:imidazole glycerol phosphate synthase subunit HisH [Gammaproteobacteria bacterium]|nr:imidazole glycerol phosphate synthase subunit HisH [Gammaproteobacteria bacterium]